MGTHGKNEIGNMILNRGIKVGDRIRLNIWDKDYLITGINPYKKRCHRKKKRCEGCHGSISIQIEGDVSSEYCVKRGWRGARWIVARDN